MGRRSQIADYKNRLWDEVPADTVPRPTIASATPMAGDSGAAVAITGTGFWYPNTLLKSYYAYRVLFNDAPATNVVVTSATTLTCDAPPGASGDVWIRVVGPGGQSTPLSGFVLNALQTESGLNILTEAGDFLFPED